jgi:hypothetical protein
MTFFMLRLVHWWNCDMDRVWHNRETENYATFWFEYIRDLYLLVCLMWNTHLVSTNETFCRYSIRHNSYSHISFWYVMNLNTGMPEDVPWPYYTFDDQYCYRHHNLLCSKWFILSENYLIHVFVYTVLHKHSTYQTSWCIRLPPPSKCP